MPALLIIDDSQETNLLIRRLFQRSNLHTVSIRGAQDGIRAISEHEPEAVLLHAVDEDGLQSLTEIRRLHPHLPVIVTTSAGTCDLAIEATKRGAFEYLSKPLDPDHLQHAIQRALDLSRSAFQRPSGQPEHLVQPDKKNVLVGNSTAMQQVAKAIGYSSQQSLPTLICGEPGTGKELIARTIHQHGSRADAPFVTVPVQGIPEMMLEADLFGLEPGSFSNADQQRTGKLTQAEGGVLFLDEIADTSLVTQSKLTRLLSDREYERVGGEEPQRADVQIIAATSRDLHELVNAERFRSDLFYLLNVNVIQIPPLRSRREDIPLLAEHYLRRFCRELGKQVNGFTPEANALLTQYNWPGNVRELQSVIRQALLRSPGPLLSGDFLPEQIRRPSHDESHTTTQEGEVFKINLHDFIAERLHMGFDNIYDEWKETVERPFLVAMLRQTDGNQVKASKALGITRTTLRNRLRTLNIVIDREVE